tara:strand:+ start:2657 stop:3685 length:1029 start_codon:yes stop_codon:yes gene_type:complete
MANAISTSLSGFVQEDVEKYFLSPLFLGEEYLNNFDLLSNVKGSIALDHFASAEKITVAHSGAAFAGTAGAAYTQVSLVTGQVEAEFEQRFNTFEGTVKSKALKMGTAKDDIDGTVLKTIISEMMLQGVKRDFNRQIWFGDTGMTGTGAANYTPYNGIFVALQGLDAAQELVIGITADTPSTGCTLAATGVYTGAELISIFEAVYDAAPAELKELPKVMFISGVIADAYMKYLRSQGVSESFVILQDGTPKLTWNGIELVVRRDWDSIIGSDYALIDDASAADSIGRVVMVAKQAIAVGTDFDSATFDTWFSQDNKAYRFRLGYLAGAALKDKKLAVVAYHK